MPLKLVINSANPSVGALVIVEIVRTRLNSDLQVVWSNDFGKNSSKLQFFDSNEKLLGESSSNVARYLSREYNAELYGNEDPFDRTVVDHWLSFAERLANPDDKEDSLLDYLNKALEPKTWLAAKHLTIADICIFSKINFKYEIDDIKENYGNLSRWYKQMLSLPEVQKVLTLVSKNRTKNPKAAAGKKSTSASAASKKATAVSSASTATSASASTAASVSTAASKTTSARKQEGKFIELPGAEMGKVVVRFPPEASGFLHIGHAKAALLNQYYAENFKGQLIMRFDDTNPAKENVEFERAILEDLEMLRVKPDRFTHSSDYFDFMLECCDKLLKESKAYVDDTPAQEMKEQRDQKLPSANRDNPVEKNVALWKEMVAGTARGQGCCVRAKIDYQSANGCMRDPTIYRFKAEPHPRTGTKYKVYPTYDFACPIVDAIEGVTHTLRTTEYHDRDDQFYWFVEALKLKRPYIWEYSRLNMTNTVLSKRKLTWFVAEGLVDGWDDPRFPTVRGILRRGMTVDGLKQFIIAQGSSRSVVFMEWDKIWAINKKVIDPVAVRYTALTTYDRVPVTVRDASVAQLTVANHPKDPSLGTKLVRVGPELTIEAVDAEGLREGENATFINWGNLLIEKILKDGEGKVARVEASLNLDNKDYKNTLKLTWLCAEDGQSRSTIPCYGVYFDHIITKPVLGKDDDFKDFVAKETRREIEMLGEAELRRVKKGEIIQLQRKGFFRCDVPYAEASAYSCREQALILFHVPDGHATTVGPALPGPADRATPAAKQSQKEAKAQGDSAAKLSERITAQGNRVRDVKAAKADKATIDAEVKVLLSLKAEYKAATGDDWKPSAPPDTKKSTPGKASGSSSKLSDAIVVQGNKVRDLKAAKADKAAIGAEVKALLNLKAEYKAATGEDWKPSAVPQPEKSTPPPSSSSSSSSSEKCKAGEEAAGDGISEKIVVQGNKVRDLKAAKADKAAIDAEVKALLSLKAEYKAATGKEWKPSPGGASSSTSSVSKAKAEKETTSAAEVNEKIIAQGNRVRELKVGKASKDRIDEEVKALLSLKESFKAITGEAWKPQTPEATDSSRLAQMIKVQNNLVKSLQTTKPGMASITKEVARLVELKSKFKSETGKDWVPSDAPDCAGDAAEQVRAELERAEGEGDDESRLEREICEQGNKVRELKASKAAKETIQQEVQTLLALKAAYKQFFGKEYVAPATGGSAPRQPKANPSKGGNKKEASQPSKDKDSSSSRTTTTTTSNTSSSTSTTTSSSSKTGTRLGLEARKQDNLSDWYSQVITKGEMIEYYDVSGCYILRPWSYAIWDVLKDFLDREIKKLGVQNCYFPIFVSKAALEKEKDHIADFAPEVAWVTKSGDSDLAEHIAIRPTSETVMYPAYAKWLKSHRDLPLKLNQWNNVVRWEFKHPQPFLRTREFLWQEGHTAFATKAEADEEVLKILELYAVIYEDYLAVPVVKGRKTEKEKFAGGDYTTTVEAFISASGRAIQGATSHYLGQNFSKMFDIQVEGAAEGSEKTFIYQNSWGITTRTIGVMIMIHGDDKGLVLPPRVASVQAVIVPCGVTATTSPEQKDKLLRECNAFERELEGIGKVRIKGDYRENYTPGWKFNHWELKGVPVRVELGPKDLERGQVTFVRRDTSERLVTGRASAAGFLLELLDKIQSSLFDRAKEDLTSHIKEANSWGDFCKYLDEKNMILAPFCGRIECEDNIKTDSVREEASSDEVGAPSMGAKSLCIPFEQPEGAPDKLKALKCIHTACKEKPKFYTLFGRSY